MKWLSGGLVFVNVSTVTGLLLGIIAGGLNPAIAALSLLLGLAVAVFLFFKTRVAAPGQGGQPAAEDVKESDADDEDDAPDGSYKAYKAIWLWLVVGCFAIFAFRSFCWLISVDDNQIKVQSPNNLGDMAIHLTYIRNFANGVALWPENPIYVFSNLRYPAGTDLFNALLVCVGIDINRGLIWTALLASVATCYAFYRWGGAFGIAGFLFNGGLAGFQIFRTFQFLDYQGVPSIAWKSIPLAMFVTQRGLLYAIPAGLLLLYQWRAKYFAPVGASDAQRRPPLPSWAEWSLYASMPLFHFHTFLALSMVLAFFFLLGTGEIRRQLLFLAGAAFLPATFFVWLITDHFQAGSVLKWQPGWAQGTGEFSESFFRFWFENFGITLPLAAMVLGVCAWRFWRAGFKIELKADPAFAFTLPAFAIFLFAVLFKTAPWEWDNMKIMIWAYFIILPFLWSELLSQWPVPVRVGVCIALFGSGFVSLFGGLIAGEPGYQLADRGEVDGAGSAARSIPAEARFAAFPTFNHPMLLQGRKLVLGYPGHLWTQGFDYKDAFEKLRALMEGAPEWKENARFLRARYLFWGREEKIAYPESALPWEQEARLVASGEWGAIYDLELPPQMTILNEGD